MKLNQELLKELFYYKSGALYWKSRINPAIKLDKPAGCKANDVRVIRVNKKLYLEHRLIFMFHNGYMPEKIDHKDGDRSNNKIENLRECTSAQNSWNSKKPVTNTSGVKGVSWNKINNTWRARIKYNKRRIEVGSFKTIKEAEEALIKARQKYHGEFAKHA